MGSLNYDITVWVPRRPTRDETLQGSSVAENAGGKGANQAVAASRLGADVVMIGGVGADARGEYLLSQLHAAGVDARWVLQGPTATGTALITVDPEDVSIIIVPGANADVDAKHVERSAEEISAADVLLLQGEVSAEAARAAALIAAASSTTVVFNPALYNEVAEHVLPLADVVIVNRNEAEELGAFEPPFSSLPSEKRVAKCWLREKPSRSKLPASKCSTRPAQEMHSLVRLRWPLWKQAILLQLPQSRLGRGQQQSRF